MNAKIGSVITPQQKQGNCFPLLCTPSTGRSLYSRVCRLRGGGGGWERWDGAWGRGWRGGEVGGLGVVYHCWPKYYFSLVGQSCRECAQLNYLSNVEMGVGCHRLFLFWIKHCGHMLCTRTCSHSYTHESKRARAHRHTHTYPCLLYTSDAADES